MLNRADFLGHPLDALSGPGGLASLVEPDDRDAADAHWQRLAGLEPEQVGETTLRVRGADGAIRYVRLRFSPLGWHRRRRAANGCLGLISDVTDAWTNEAREAELHEALRRRSDSRRSASSPVASRTTSTTCSPRSWRRRSCSSTTSRRADRRSTRPRSSGRRCAVPRSVRELLTFAQRDRAEPRPVDLNEIVAGMEPLLRRTLGEHIHLQITMSEIPAAGDRRPDPPRAGHPQPGGERPRRDARRWRAVDRDRHRFRRRGARATIGSSCPSPTPARGSPTRSAARMFEPFVTSKDSGQGDRSRAGDGAVHRAPVWTATSRC